MSARVVVGIDGGGTRARAVVTDEGGRELARREGPPGIVSAADPAAAAVVLADLTADVCRDAGRDTAPAALCCALAGAGRPAEREAVRVALTLAGAAAHVIVIGDAEAQMADAFDDAAGVLLVAGTGSIAWARAEDGAQLRVGGWGMTLGDEGSGCAIGRAALQAVARAADGRAPPSALFDAIRRVAHVDEPADLIAWAARASKADIAALAPPALRCADVGDAAAVQIRSVAVHELVLLAATAARRAALAAPAIALAGGLIGPHGPLRPHLAEPLRAAIAGAAILDRDVDGARGAAMLARRSLD